MLEVHQLHDPINQIEKSIYQNQLFLDLTFQKMMAPVSPNFKR